MNEIPANQNAAGTEMPIPKPDSGSLNIIAASGADPVRMQNRIWGSPSAFLASSFDPVSCANPLSWVVLGTSLTSVIQPPPSDRLADPAERAQVTTTCAANP